MCIQDGIYIILKVYSYCMQSSPTIKYLEMSSYLTALVENNIACKKEEHTTSSKTTIYCLSLWHLYISLMIMLLCVAEQARNFRGGSVNPALRCNKLQGIRNLVR